MGMLVAKRYPTVLFAKAADHTYVECGTGAKGWSCWGGKTGGTLLRQAAGSTKRADAIAEPNERAGIKCYLVNGVCHQAANRILLPASATVSGARGYAVSIAMFGPYGRVALWPCRGPFNQHAGVSGDLPECATPPAVAGPGPDEDAPPSFLEQLDWNYLRGALAIYRRWSDRLGLAATDGERERDASPEQRAALEDFQVELFEHMVDFYVAPMLADGQAQRLSEIRRRVERQRTELEERLARREITGQAFVESFNALTLAFQHDLATTMTSAQYEALLRLPKDEQVVLADPDIARRAFGE